MQVNLLGFKQKYNFRYLFIMFFLVFILIFGVFGLMQLNYIIYKVIYGILITVLGIIDFMILRLTVNTLQGPKKIIEIIEEYLHLIWANSKQLLKFIPFADIIPFMKKNKETQSRIHTIRIKF